MGWTDVGFCRADSRSSGEVGPQGTQGEVGPQGPQGEAEAQAIIDDLQ